MHVYVFWCVQFSLIPFYIKVYVSVCVVMLVRTYRFSMIL